MVTGEFGDPGNLVLSHVEEDLSREPESVIIQHLLMVEKTVWAVTLNLRAAIDQTT